MSSTIIRISNLSKQYRLGYIGAGTLRGDFQRWHSKIRGKEDPFLKIGTENSLEQEEGKIVWALQDINLEVKQGEVLGIIGKNGAGKSTLLKILSRVTGPTTGTINMKGRIASLLEVGTGFHPELTGRENIFLNGAILGMRKTEVKNKLEDIVEFAGIRKYLDTPVKRYSSGMHVRLAFAVAAHLEPEILVVDEVLAVGDAEFQSKAIGKMQDVAKNQGRTVVFVSHNMAAVKSLCTRGMVLVNGKISQIGSVDNIITSYLKKGNEVSNYKKWTNPEIKNEIFELLEIGIKRRNGDIYDIVKVDDELEFALKFRILENGRTLHLTLHIKDEQGNKLFSTFWDQNMVNNLHEMGIHSSSVVFPANFFNWGTFYIDFLLVENRQKAILIENDIISYTLINKQKELGSWMGKEPGGIAPIFKWKHELLNPF